MGPTFKEITEVCREGLNTVLDSAIYDTRHHGLFSTEAMMTLGGVMCLGDNVYLPTIMNKAVDNYRIESNRDGLSVHNRWGFTIFAGNIMMTWVDNEGHAAVIREKEIFLHDIKYSSYVTCRALRSSGIWPIREGLLPVPPRAYMRILPYATPNK